MTTASPDLCLLFVTKTTSGVGRRMESVLATLQTRRRDAVRVRKVDADDEPDLVGRLGINQIPTLVFVKNRHSVAQICGRTTLEEIERVLAAIAVT